MDFNYWGKCILGFEGLKMGGVTVIFLSYVIQSFSEAACI